MARSAELFTIGLDLGGTNIQAGLVDARTRVLARAKLPTEAHEGPEAVIDRLCQAAREVTRAAGLPLKRVAAVGVGAPGPVDVHKGLLLQAVNLRWSSVPLAKLLSKRLQRPVFVDNDVNVAAWGEFVAGAGRGYPDLLAIWVGTGIGAGLILNGQLFRGAHFTAGEIGHTILNADAPLGRRTLENLASRKAVVDQLTHLIASGHPSRLANLAQKNPFSIRSKALAKALRAGDPLTDQLLRQAAHYIGIAAANALTMLSLRCIILGGGLSQALGRPWVNWVRQSLREAVFPPMLAKCPLRLSQLGDDAGIVGAARLAADWKRPHC